MSTTSTNGDAEAIVSYLQGTVGAPKYYPAWKEVVTTFAASGATTTDTPACQACLVSYSNGWTHSSGAWMFHDGHVHILMTFVTGDPRYPRATQIVAVDVSDSGAVRSLRVEGDGAGSGALASEIAVPLVANPNIDMATIGYDFSGRDLYPGVKALKWNLDTNAVTSSRVLHEGSLSPTGYDLGRWVDFTDAIAPIPGTGTLLLAGQVASPSSKPPYPDPNRSTYWSWVSGG